jgi:hypothetical protein
VAFVPHQTIPGVSPEAAQALLEIQRQIGQDLADLRRGPVVTALQREDYGAREDEYVRCAPPAGGMTILLPPSRPQNQGKSVRVLVETVLTGGGVTISVTRGTINGLVTITLTTVGLVEFTSDGLGNWLSAWAPGTTGTTPGIAGTMLTPQGPPAQQQEPQRAPVIPGPRGLTGKSASAAPPGVPGLSGWRSSIVPGVLPIIARGRVLGTQIDGDNDNDQAHPITGAQVGSLARFASLISDSTSTGTVATYPLTAPTTTVEFKSGVGATIDIQSFAILEEGSEVAFHINDNAATVVTFEYDFAGATANSRLRPPGNQDLILYPGDSAKFRYFNNRWRCVAVSVQPTGRLLAVTQYVTGSGTHTYDPRTRYYEAHMQSGGAAGGGTPACTALESAAGGGGQAGPFVIASGAPAAATAAYVVGAGGSGVAGADGDDGAATSFAAATAGATASGGKAGVASSTQTATAGGGDNVTGAQGDAGSAGFSNALLFAAGGKGGSGRYGGGGWGRVRTAAGSDTGAVGRRPGAGGSGATNVGVGGTKAGGPGATGDIWVYEWS